MSDSIDVYFGMLSLSMTGNLVKSTRFLRWKKKRGHSHAVMEIKIGGENKE